MPTTKSTHRVAEREDGALVATVDMPEWVNPLQVGLATQMHISQDWLVILWDENTGSTDFHVPDRGSAKLVLEFHTAVMARLTRVSA